MALALLSELANRIVDGRISSQAAMRNGSAGSKCVKNCHRHSDSSTAETPQRVMDVLDSGGC